MKKIFLTVAFAVFYFPKVFSSQVEIRSYEQVEISQRDRVTLQDVLEVKPAREELRPLFAKAVLREIGGHEGQKIQISSSEITNSLRKISQMHRDFRKLHPKITLVGSTEVLFSNDHISKEEVKRNIIQRIQAKCSDCDVEVDIGRLPSPESLTWELDYAKLPMRGPFILIVRDNQRNLYLAGKIRVSKSLPVSRVQIAPHVPIMESDLSEKSVDITFFQEEPLKKEEILGKKLGNYLQPGLPFFGSQFRRDPEARRGQVVRALYRKDGMAISHDLIAEESGFTGDVIRMKNQDTKKISQGKVVEPGVVELQ